MVQARGDESARGIVTLYATRLSSRTVSYPPVSPVPPRPAQTFGRSRRRRGYRWRAAALAGGLSALLVSPAAAATVHVVQPGETLWGIAQQYGTTVDTLARINQLSNPNLILPGMRLTVASGTDGIQYRHTVQAGETLSLIAQQYGVSLSALQQANPGVNPNRLMPGQVLLVPIVSPSSNPSPLGEQTQFMTHIVQAGESLWDIAQHYGVSLDAVIETNHLTDPNRIMIGQKLIIPTGQAIYQDQRGVQLSGVPAYRQSLPLSCEAAALSIVTAYYGRPISEWVFIENMPHHPNPHYGFRGNMSGAFGGIDNYGVYAEPLVPLLARYGFHAQAVYAQGDRSVLTREIAAGHPVIVWITNNASVQQRLRASYNGESFTLVPQEHVVVVYGYDDTQVYVVDPGDGQYRTFSWDDFMRAWGYFDGMALLVVPAQWG